MFSLLISHLVRERFGTSTQFSWLLSARPALWKMLRSALLSLGAAVLSLQNTWTPGHLEDYKHGLQDAEPYHNKPFCSWKCLKFTVQWPAAFCLSLEKMSHCKLPENITSWTIHGLWPLKATNCCQCWPMFQSDITDLHAELVEQWPSLIRTQSSFHFWRQEWQKHGVCVACVEGLNSPSLYFHICLELHRKYDFSRALREAGIHPSCNESYQVAAVHQVLAPLLGDQIEIQCITDNKGREVWFQLKISLSRSLELGCQHQWGAGDGGGGRQGHPAEGNSGGHPCPEHTPLYLYPIDHQRPEEPCG